MSYKYGIMGDQYFTSENILKTHETEIALSL